MRTVIFRLLGPAVALGLVAPAPGRGQQSTADVAARYLELTLSQRYDELLPIYSADAVFFDPTGDVFQGRVAGGPVVGADSIVALQQSWGILASEFDVTRKFAVGGYAVYNGVFRVRYAESDPWIRIPFVTVLRVEGGRVSQRTDFGEYIESFGLGDRFAANTSATRDVAARYLEAYLGADFDTQASLLAGDAVFQDPTAQVYGPNSGQPLNGREAILGRRRQTFQNVKDFDLEIAESFVANHHAVFIGTTRYTLANGARYEQPAVFVVEVRNGRVTRHWDFVDYSVGPVG